MKLTLQEHRKETSDVETFLFEPEEPVQFVPGQYMKYTLEHENPDNRGRTRYFSIASAPSENIVQITTRFYEESSTFKTALQAMQPGDTIEANPPSGMFTYPHPDRPAVFIAGGIGITPFRSILVDLDSRGIAPQVTLIYANRSEEIAFKALFDELANKYPSFTVHYLIEPERITADYIRQHVPDLTERTVYISGPEPMVEAFSTMFTDELGVERERIEEDFFPGYAD